MVKRMTVKRLMVLITLLAGSAALACPAVPGKLANGRFAADANLIPVCGAAYTNYRARLKGFDPKTMWAEVYRFRNTGAATDTGQTLMMGLYNAGFLSLEGGKNFQVPFPGVKGTYNASYAYQKDKAGKFLFSATQYFIGPDGDYSKSPGYLVLVGQK